MTSLGLLYSSSVGEFFSGLFVKISHFAIQRFGLGASLGFFAVAGLFQKAVTLATGLGFFVGGVVCFKREPNLATASGVLG
jgi:hypothetical protein